jgi:hypothetical protein
MTQTALTPATPAATALFHITMHKDRSTWSYFTRNEVGGGFGSNYCGSLRVALKRAAACIKPGQQYRLTINGKDRGVQVQP